jgi:hypothetical protein
MSGGLERVKAMGEMVVVYESNEPFWAQGLMDALREDDFNPELANDTGLNNESILRDNCFLSDSSLGS